MRKGACLSTLAYGDIAMREMNDLDLLVPERSLRAAADILVGSGYQPHRPFTVEADVAFVHHLSTFLKGSVAVEIHWNVTHQGCPIRSTLPNAGAAPSQRLYPRAVKIKCSSYDRKKPKTAAQTPK